MYLDISPNVKTIEPDFFPWAYHSCVERSLITLHPKGIIEFQLKDDELNKNIFAYILRAFERFEISTVGKTGLEGCEEVGSVRFSTMSSNLAQFLEKVIFPIKPYIKDYSHVSHYFRFMKYSKGGEHYPHYDSDYESLLDSNLYTAYSLVMYLNDCEDGELVFCNDHKYYDVLPHTNPLKAIAADWDRQCTEEEIYAKFKPKAGRIILFPHELCHSVLPFTGEQRIIIRGDLYFKKK